GYRRPWQGIGCPRSLRIGSGPGGSAAAGGHARGRPRACAGRGNDQTRRRSWRFAPPRQTAPPQVAGKPKLNETYAPTFFARELDRARSSAKAVVPLVMARVAPKSALDLGCGHGFWLEPCIGEGGEEYIGVDGEWVPREALHFEADRFIAHRLDKPLQLNRRFDLAVSLEVAEHLPERAAKHFVRSIVEHAPCVLFSA